MSMGLGYGLSEEFLYNDAGRPLNDNLLDYKIPTAMDTPDLHVKFIQLEDPTGPYGNKSLGEPPAIPVRRPCAMQCSMPQALPWIPYP